MAPPAPASKVVYSTAGTVSSPLNLDSYSNTSSAKGEHESVTLNGNANGDSKAGRKVVRPKVKVTLTSLTVNNSGTLRKINSVVIPIVYSEKFYKDVLSPDLDDINKLIYYGDIPVGAICCRIETKDAPAPTLVILTLAVLAPYRSQGLGRALLLHALTHALDPIAPPPPIPSSTQTNTRASLTVAPPRKKVNRAMAHVQVGNEGAKRFYEGLGFKAGEVVDNYYSKMEPRGAILMVLEDIASTGVGAANGNGQP